MSAISIVLVIVVAFFAGMEGILDEWQFHQPLVACTLIGLVTGHPTEGIMLGGSLQMMALGWANVGAAVAPDAALASVASAIIMVLGLQGGSTDATKAINTSIAVAVPLSVAGLFLTMLQTSKLLNSGRLLQFAYRVFVSQSLLLHFALFLLRPLQVH